MRVEWQDFVISSQLLRIFIEGKIKAIQLVNARVIVQTVLLSFFSVFIFSMPSKVILSLAARAKMSLSWAQSIFGSLSVAGNRVLYKNSKDKYEKHPYVMRFIYIAYDENYKPAF